MDSWFDDPVDDDTTWEEPIGGGDHDWDWRNEDDYEIIDDDWEYDEYKFPVDDEYDYDIDFDEDDYERPPPHQDYSDFERQQRIEFEEFQKRMDEEYERFARKQEQEFETYEGRKPPHRHEDKRDPPHKGEYEDYVERADEEYDSYTRKIDREDRDFERRQSRQYKEDKRRSRSDRKDSHRMKSSKNDKKVKESRNQKFQTMIEDLQKNPMKLQFVMKGMIFFFTAFVVVLIGSYIALLSSHKEALERYHFLYSVYTNPQARVVSVEEADKILNAGRQSSAGPRDIEQQPYMPPKIDFNQIRVEPPTLQNLPKAQPKDMDFNYSLCESIDYQQESIPMPRQPAMQAPPQPVVAQPTMKMPSKAGPSYITMTREQLAKMLAATAVSEAPAPVIQDCENATGKFSEINRMD